MLATWRLLVSINLFSSHHATTTLLISNSFILMNDNVSKDCLPKGKLLKRNQNEKVFVFRARQQKLEELCKTNGSSS